MRKKSIALFLVLQMLFFAQLAFATDIDSHTTSNSVSFSTVGQVVTFNTAVNSLLVMNHQSSGGNLHVVIRQSDLGWNPDRRLYFTPTLSTGYRVSGSSILLEPGDSLQINLRIKKLGFVGTGTGSISYIATSDTEQ